MTIQAARHSENLRTDLLNWILQFTHFNAGLDPHLNYLFSQNLCDVVGFYNQYWELNFFDIVAELIHSQTSVLDSLIVAALKYKIQGHAIAALKLLEEKTYSGRSSRFSRYITAELLRDLRRFEEARAYCRELQRDFPEFTEAESCITMCDVDELLTCRYDYYQILNHAHRVLKPSSYIEIGVATGKSLALTRTGTCSIGIDPEVKNLDSLLFHSPEAVPTISPMTSNEFFSSQTIPSLLGHATCGMAFIDGDHTFEQSLMDFIHLERNSDPSSVIFIHDCLPVSPEVAERQRATKFWCGDVWRIIPCLKAYRPDLEIVTFPAPPTGLAMITCLNPVSQFLMQNLTAILEKYMSQPLPDSYSERCSLLNVTTEDPLTVLDAQLKKIPTPC